MCGVGPDRNLLAAFASLAQPVEELANEACVWSQLTNSNRVFDLLFYDGLL